MDNLENIAEQAHTAFDARNLARDQALVQARQLTRHAAYAIRAIHRDESSLADEHLVEARAITKQIGASLTSFPDLFYAGYTQDAIKEFAEAHITCALIQNQPLPTPDQLGIEYATYLNGLAESVGELRRRCLDMLRLARFSEAERLLSCMDDIYAVLVTMDYPDAITNGLRRQTDLVRGILERTRGDLTISVRQEDLKQRLDAAFDRLQARKDGDENHSGV